MNLLTWASVLACPQIPCITTADRGIYSCKVYNIYHEAWSDQVQVNIGKVLETKLSIIVPLNTSEINRPKIFLYKAWPAFTQVLVPFLMSHGKHLK